MSEPQPLSPGEFAFIDQGKADWFTRRLLATIKARDVEIEQLKAQLAVRPRSRSKKQKIEDALRESDLTAQVVGRQDIDYGHHETLPRGEHIVNVKKG